MGSLSAKNAMEKFSRLGTFKEKHAQNHIAPAADFAYLPQPPYC